MHQACRQDGSAKVVAPDAKLQPRDLLQMLHLLIYGLVAIDPLLRQTDPAPLSDHIDNRNWCDVYIICILYIYKCACKGLKR